jgi:hypothetical protein
MKKSSNSDNIEFVCLTDDTLERYIRSIPLDVEEITIWNYKMCIHPEDIENKDYLIIPALNQFTKLKCVRFYNERLLYFPGIFPENVERVFFVSCIVNNKWTNVCIYGKLLTCINFHYSLRKYENPVIGLLQYESKKAINRSKNSEKETKHNKSSFVMKARKSNSNKVETSTWFGWFRRFQFSGLFRKNNPRVCPKEIEMVQYITLDPQSTIPFNQSVIDDTIDTVKLSSIQRLKKYMIS